MELQQLAPGAGVKQVRRRLGRGHGSGRGKTSGAGTKGQNSRAGGGTKLFFEGGQNPWTMKIPHRRGFSNNRFRKETQVIHLRDLERAFAAGDDVTPAALKERGLIRDEDVRVKLLGDGELTKRLALSVHAASASAAAAIEQAGGSLTLLEQRRGRKGAAAASPAAEGDS